MEADLRHDPDLLVLDVLMPGYDGLQVMARVRHRRPVPIVLLTARGEERDRISGLRLGADDYVVKPFSPREVVARVHAVLRRVEPHAATASVIRFGALEIDGAARTVAPGRRAGGAHRRASSTSSFLWRAIRAAPSRATS